MKNIRLTYWFAKTSRPFKEKRMQCPSIHMVINSKIEEKTNCEVHNALNLVRLRLKVGKSAEQALMSSPEWTPSVTGRSILKRWLRNLEISKKRQ